MREVIEDGTKEKYVMRCRWCNTKFSFTYKDTYQGMTINMVNCPVCKTSMAVDYSEKIPHIFDKEVLSRLFNKIFEKEN